MNDYIDVLLLELSGHSPSEAGGAYYLQRAREEQAYSALWDTLSPSQQELFLAYDEERNATAGIREDAMARRAFLLARDIFR